MLITCRCSGCPYHSNQGFCLKPTVLNIDENGMCEVVWKRGQPRKLEKPFTDAYYPKGEVLIVDGKECHDERRINGNTVDKD